MRMVLAIIVGFILAAVCVKGIEAIGHTLYPLPPGFDLTNPRDIERLMSVMPAPALAFVLVGWFVGALAGALTANFIARRTTAGWIVALLVIAAGVATMVMIPHPGWMWAAGIALPLVAGFVASRFAPTPNPQ